MKAIKIPYDPNLELSMQVTRNHERSPAMANHYTSPALHEDQSNELELLITRLLNSTVAIIETSHLLMYQSQFTYLQNCISRQIRACPPISHEKELKEKSYKACRVSTV